MSAIDIETDENDDIFFEKMASILFTETLTPSNIESDDFFDVVFRSWEKDRDQGTAGEKRKLFLKESNPDQQKKVKVPSLMDQDYMRRLLLIRTPKLLADAFNIGDINCIRSIINSVCDKDCVFQKTVEHPMLYGRHHFIELFECGNAVFPDAVIITSPAILQHGIVTAPCVFTGTKLFEPNNFLNHKENFAPRDCEGGQIINFDGVGSVYEKGSINLFLDAKKTKFVKVWFEWEVCTFTEVNLTLDSILPNSISPADASSLTVSSVDEEFSGIENNHIDLIETVPTIPSPVCNASEPSTISALRLQAIDSTPIPRI